MKGERITVEGDTGKEIINKNNNNMPHPKHRFSQTRTAKRRTHDALETAQLTTCSNCGAQVMYHHVCPECGYYRGKLAIEKNAEE